MEVAGHFLPGSDLHEIAGRAVVVSPTVSWIACDEKASLPHRGGVLAKLSCGRRGFLARFVRGSMD
jgi:hypothetical protein